jgi:hypothetical protein
VVSAETLTAGAATLAARRLFALVEAYPTWLTATSEVFDKTSKTVDPPIWGHPEATARVALIDQS